VRPSRSLAVLVSAGLSVVAAPAPEGRALYRAHDRLVSEDPADTTPHVLDNDEFGPIAGQSKVKVNAILPMGDRIYVGGTFTGVRNTGSSARLSRPGIFALDPATHRVDETFAPVLDGAVEELAPSPDGRAIFVGGAFNTVNGESFPKLAKLDAVTGVPSGGFGPRPSAEVKDIALAGGRLALAGPFTIVAGQPRRGLAVVDLDTGAPDPNVDIDFREPRQGAHSRVESIAVTPDGNTMVAGGNFTEVDGLERWQVALLDITPGRRATVLDWHTDRFNDTVVTRNSDDVPACAGGFDAHVKDMDMSPDGTYFVVVTTGGYTSRGPLCDTASRWETAARGESLQPTWANYNGGDTITGVGITGTAVYVGGHMRWMNNFDNNGSAGDAEPGRGSVEREGLAALDPNSGLPLPWNPRRERGHGPEAIVSTADGLWVGSDTSFVGKRDFDGSPRPGEYHPKLAFFPLAGGSPVPAFAAARLPADLYAGGDGGIVRRFFDGARLGGPRPVDVGFDWSEVRGAFTVGDRLYTGTEDGELVRRTFDRGRFGPPLTVDLRGMGSSHLPIEDVTGMFYERGRLYFTVDGEEELHYRYFLPQEDVADDVVGDNQPFLVAGGDRLDWSEVEGMTYAQGHIYFSRDGDLHRVAFSDGKVRGAPAVVAAGVGSGALFLLPSTVAPSTTTTTSAPPAAPPGPPGGGAAPAGRSGYWMVGAGGQVHPFGDAAHLGDATPLLGGREAVDLEPTPSHDGYWIVDTAGRVHPFGDARHLGDADARELAPDEQVTSLSATPSGTGYWLFTTRGRVLAFGDAAHLGDLAAVALNGPVLDSLPTASGRGYYMVASDGGIFTFGDARFLGSMGAIRLNAPVQSLVPDGDGVGYWLVASDGGVFSFEAPFRGSMGATPLNQPVTGMVPFGSGYLMVAADGGIFNFSDQPFHGSLGAQPPPHPIVAVAPLP